jgi:predicted metal-dependent hydrolase
MKRSASLHKKKIDYTLKISKRAKRIRLAVYCDGSCVVTAPEKVNHWLIERFIAQKSKWIYDKIKYFSSFSHTLHINNNEKDIETIKQQALALVQMRIQKFNAHYGFTFSKINIKNQKTRWGSCSRKGNLNFNYKIALLPEKLADYIVVHELCHLGEFNHCRAFWALVAQTLPDYCALRSELRRVGAKEI